MNRISKISKGIAKYLSGLMTDAEKKEFRSWLAKHPEEEQLFKRLCEDSSFRKQYLQQDKRKVEAAIRGFDRTTGGHRRMMRRKSFFSYAAAIVVIGLMVGGIWLTGMWPDREVKPNIAEISEEILPGGAKALLKLADGQLVDLSDNVVHRTIPECLEIDVRKGEIVYSTSKGEENTYNELILPRGGEYRLILSDGTVVRLNSGSKLRYPVAFSGSCREVELDGEAFFGVKTDSLRPFCVKMSGMTVKAYGTAFNINTHTAGHIYTALVSGRVGILVEDSGREYEMRPSQMADFSRNTQQVEIQDADLAPYVAWTEGRFVFVNETLEQMLNTLGLWYDFDVVFEQEKIRQLHFSGSMKRYDQITRILDAISYTVGVEIHQKGKTLFVREQIR